jgi:hypothetical protein
VKCVGTHGLGYFKLFSPKINWSPSRSVLILYRAMYLVCSWVFHTQFLKCRQGCFVPWGRCYGNYFLRFLPILGEKIGVFLKNQCYDQNFAYFIFVLSQKSQYFSLIFWRNFVFNHNFDHR